MIVLRLKIIVSIMNKHNNDNCADQESDLKSVGNEKKYICIRFVTD